MNIIVLGGGTAGWLTALLTQRFYPDDTIIVVESEDIGILGAGEGTVPHFIDVLDFIGVPVSDLVKHAKATLKLGIEFKNWHGDNTSYFHGFAGAEHINLHSCDLLHMYHLLVLKQMAEDTSIDEVYFHSRLAKQAKVPFSFRHDVANQSNDPILRLDSYGSFGLHFDARLLADYLKSFALNRGIVRIEGKVSNAVTDETGNITALNMVDGNTVLCDFVFDCSGFARLIIGKHFNTEWLPYTDQMLLDTAMPFFIPHDNKNIKPQTTAIAMKHGWVWHIPVQGRYGCGYVFSSKHINEEQALAEIREVFGEVDSPRTFKFKAGMYKDTYVKNCMAVGLAQGFIEPLEATSIWVSCLNVIHFLRSNGIKLKSDVFRKSFNNACYDRNHQVVEFLYLHYLTERNDSEFWKTFKQETKMLPKLKEKLDLWAETPITEDDRFEQLFTVSSWQQVADGNRLINREAAKYQYLDLQMPRRIGNSFNSFKKNQDVMLNVCMTHEQFINHLKEE
jgi:tryptophan halogenase